MNPMVFLFCAMRASFTIDSIAPTVGEEAEVPYTRKKLPSS